MDDLLEQHLTYFYMSSLKFLCAVQVREETGILELDEYVSEVKEFLLNGKDGFFQESFTYYSSLVKTLGWKKVVNGGTEYYVNRKGRICGLLEEKGYFVGDERVFFNGRHFSTLYGRRQYKRGDVRLVVLRETRYMDGKKDGLEIVRNHKDSITANTNWKQDKKHGQTKEFDESGLPTIMANYRTGSLVGRYIVYSATLKGKRGKFLA
ncbi:hypothetical protein [Brazilian marseillevirus]|uniref:hypothetical protein n=1 Tax=Brazilian marseillevirus TaxID=1813599 RepID=UPI000784E13B|nr:hypothetical protein A3303_gp132 [Brazilian marseillevirus]AMQ10640.1 hypothetical protein [Brazilian marseillevirus]